MRDLRAFALLVSFAPFVYVGVRLGSSIPLVEDPVVIASAAGSVLLGLYYLWGRWFGRVAAPIGFLGLTLLFLVTATDTSIGQGLAAEVTLGALLATPVATLLIFSEGDNGPGARLVGLQLALLQGLALLAAQQALGPLGLAATSPHLVSGYLTAIGDQLEGLGTLISGGTPATMPLAAVNDSGFVALAGLAILIVVLSIVRPVTGREVALPIFPGTVPEAAEAVDRTPGLSPSFREALEARSLPEGPPRGDFPGLTALAVGVGAAVLFLALAYTVPSWSLLVAVVAAFGGVAALVATIFRPLRGSTKRDAPGGGNDDSSTTPGRGSVES